MKSFLLNIKIFLLFLRFPVLTYSYPYYFFDIEKVNTSNATFRRYIIPQLKSIIVEFYHIYKKISPSSIPIISLKHDIEKLKSNWIDFQINCQKVNIKCEKKLNNLYSTALKTDKKILKFQDINTSKNLLKNEKIDSWLTFISIFDNLSNISSNHTHRIEHLLLTTSDTYDLSWIAFSKYPDFLNHMILDIDLALTEILSIELRIPFEPLYQSFIKDIEEFILKDSNQKFLIERLGQLNLAWNSFHMKLSRGTLKVNPRIKQTINIMHNRWNSILKIYLKNTNFVKTKDIPKATFKSKPKKKIKKIKKITPEPLLLKTKPTPTNLSLPKSENLTLPTQSEGSLKKD